MKIVRKPADVQKASAKKDVRKIAKKSAARRKPAKKETKLAATVKKLVRPENNEFLLPIKKGCSPDFL